MVLPGSQWPNPHRFLRLRPSNVSAREFEQQREQGVLAGDGGKSLKTAGQKEPAESKMFSITNGGYLEKCGHGISAMLILLFIVAKSIICPLLVHLILPAPAVDTAHEYDPIKIIVFYFSLLMGKQLNA